MVVAEPCMQIRSNSIIQYDYFNVDRKKNGNENYLKNFFTEDKEHKSYSGKLSPGAKKRLTKSIELLLQSVKRQMIKTPYSNNLMPFKISHCCVTIADNIRTIPAKECHKTCLEPFILWMRRKYGMSSFIWKAEHQQRGQLHYHIVSDCFIPKENIRQKWNELQREAGYLDDWYKKNQNYNPPGTWINRPKPYQDMAYYLKKEVIKMYQNENSVEGKVWDCSINLKQNRYFTINEASNERLDKLIKEKKIWYKVTDQCTIYIFKRLDPVSVLNECAKKEYRKFQNCIYNHSVYDPRPAPDIPIIKPKLQAKTVQIPVQLDLFSLS